MLICRLARTRVLSVHKELSFFIMLAPLTCFLITPALSPPLFAPEQVWFPDSAYKTAQAIRDFDNERLPLIIFANWRGFSGGMRDMFEEVCAPLHEYLCMCGRICGSASPCFWAYSKGWG